MNKKIIQLKNAKWFFPNKTTKIRREDVMEVLSHKEHLTNSEIKEFEKLIKSMDSGIISHEYLAVRKTGKIVLISLEDDE